MNMKVLCAFVAAVSVVSFVHAEEELLLKPKTGTGRVTIVNAQTKVGNADLESIAALFASETGCNFTIGDKVDGASLWLKVINDPQKPVMLLAPEDHWGEVNVAKVVDDLKNDKAKEKFLVPRTRKLIIKALSLLCGGGSSQFPGNIMNTATVRELDYIQEQIPVDMVDNYNRYLDRIGVTRRVMMPYLEACVEGWAPAPTNDAQKAIWNEVKNPATRWDKDFGGKQKK